MEATAILIAESTDLKWARSLSEKIASAAQATLILAPITSHIKLSDELEELEKAIKSAVPPVLLHIEAAEALVPGAPVITQAPIPVQAMMKRVADKVINLITHLTKQQKTGVVLATSSKIRLSEKILLKPHMVVKKPSE
mgnify:CR=1 FL=1